MRRRAQPGAGSATIRNSRAAVAACASWSASRRTTARPARRRCGRDGRGPGARPRPRAAARAPALELVLLSGREVGAALGLEPGSALAGQGQLARSSAREHEQRPPRRRPVGAARRSCPARIRAPSARARSVGPDRPGQVACKARLECDLRPGKRARDRACRLGLLGSARTSSSSTPGTSPVVSSSIRVIAKPARAARAARARSSQVLRRMARLAQQVRERHREAAGLRGADQLLRVGRALDVLDAGLSVNGPSKAPLPSAIRPPPSGGRPASSPAPCA